MGEVPFVVLCDSPTDHTNSCDTNPFLVTIHVSLVCFFFVPAKVELIRIPLY